MQVMRLSENITEEELDDEIVQLKYWYSPIDLNFFFHKKKIRCVGKLSAILDRVNPQDLQGANINEIVLSALTIIYYFSMRLKLSRSSCVMHFSFWRKRQFRKAETVFQKTMDKLLPERSGATIAIMLTFFTDIALWPYENFVGRILEIVLSFTRDTITVLDMILTDALGAVSRDIAEGRHRIRVLYYLLNSEHLVLETPKLIHFIRRILDYYINGVEDRKKELRVNLYLKKGFEVCLRRIFEKVSNEDRMTVMSTLLDWYSSLDVDNEDLLEYSTLVQYAAELYKVDQFSECLPDQLVARILNSFVGSPHPLHSLTGCRLVQHFLDRQLNAKYVMEPKLYYVTTEMLLKSGEDNSNSREFITLHKDKLNEYFILAITNHCENSTNLKAVFTVVSCMVLEVPCGMTAASAAFMMMVVQDYALQEQNISPKSKHWMHAIVVSVMSLICWVHKAPVLCKYVNQIITRRAKEAPQLNPPLLAEYNERTSKSWTNASLFFEDWQLRYGLWKAFSVAPDTLLI